MKSDAGRYILATAIEDVSAGKMVRFVGKHRVRLVRRMNPLKRLPKSAMGVTLGAAKKGEKVAVSFCGVAMMTMTVKP